MALIVKYKFQNVDANGNSVTLLPQFPSGVSYTKTDVVEGNITTRVIETDDLSKVTYIRFGCDEDIYVTGAWEYLTEILDINISYVDTFYKMFRGCELLNKIDVSNWDTSKVINMSSIFERCSSLTSLDVSNWDTSNVTTMSSMFNTCISLTSLDVHNWNTGKVTNMSNVFNECNSLTSLDLSNWNTSIVTNMYCMFRRCFELTSLDVSNFDTKKVTNMYAMFSACSNLTQLDVSNFDTSNVINMEFMFINCSQLTQLDVSNFDTSNVTSMVNMFEKCANLTTLDVSNWDIKNVTKMHNMFSGCSVKNVGLIYCPKETIDKLANCITSPCNFYVTNKTYTSPNPLVKCVMYREDKKPLLYYNDETQAWEKPVLRQWDSIEKHADGKYYYHKRSGEVTFNGSEKWTMNNDNNNGIMSATCNTIGKVKGTAIGDKLASSPSSDIEGVLLGKTTGKIMVCLDIEKLSTKDIQGFKQWLQANPTTVVYQLAEEKVYECTDLDLVTYTDTTSLMVERGVIAPKTTLKNHQNIANIATILQEKVSVLENNVGYATEIFVDSKIEPINNEIDNVNTDLKGSSISVDSKDGYLKDIEILGNTIQNQNDLADIRSVGDKVENQELYEIPVLSCGKNLYDESKMVVGMLSQSSGEIEYAQQTYLSYVYYIKVKPNTTYVANKSHTINIVCYYDKDKKYISNEVSRTSFITPSNCEFIRFRIASTVLPKELQIEEGTVVTPYEPYQEDKLTILSPVQLEKVGDVADRIICKDGVWGVEKNVETLYFKDLKDPWVYARPNCVNASLYGISFVYDDYNMSRDWSKCITNKFSVLGSVWDLDIPNLFGLHPTANNIYISTPININTVVAVKEYIKDSYIKYVTTQPQFIPLPHDQQVKLKTFANKTNIHFECEIEPTLKASVPKSLGASVSSHSEQIDNLSKEIEKINNLEESVTREVISESDFTTVENTNNGYFDDVKLEGRTLVNLMPNQIFSKTAEVSNGWISEYFTLAQSTKANTEYTIIFNIISNIAKVEKIYFGGKNKSFKNLVVIDISSSNYYCTKAISSDETCDHSQFFVQFQDIYSSGDFSCEILLLEGDHTQNPPKFFEGIKSVGDGVDEISVLSANDNLVDYLDKSTLTNNGVLDGRYLKQTSANLTASARYNVVKGKEYTFAFDIYSDVSANNLSYCLSYATAYGGATLSEHIGYGVGSLSKRVVIRFTAKEEYVYLILGTATSITVKDISLNLGNTDGVYTLPKRDKKHILYYNDETQTWEKPILGEWDSIEKHNDGKYYYHKRSGEVVLDGSENKTINISLIGDIVNINLSNYFTTDRKPNSEGICDKLACVYSTSEEGIFFAYGLHINLNKAKLSTQDAAGFKAWLQSNPTTVVYQLEQEEVYECTDLDLITYSGETNLLVKSGVLNPKVSLKVSNGVGNVVTMLQNKVTMLEQMIYDLMKMFNNQQSNIDE